MRNHLTIAPPVRGSKADAERSVDRGICDAPDGRRPMLSVVVPLYNEELVIQEMHRRLITVLEAMGETFEVILVNDGSRDQTVPLAKQICARDPNIKLVNLSRNFGHQLAITAGMDYCRGDCVVIIDADLQDPPEVIPLMVDKWRNEGCHVVYGVRAKREGEGWFKLWSAKMFYRLLRRMTSVEIPVDTGDFRLMDRRVLDEFLSMREQARFVRGMVSWVGFKQDKILFERDKRFAGETKYPFRKMLKFAIDGMFSFSDMPLKIASSFGLISAGISFIFMIYGFVVRALFPEFSLPGWASTFMAVLFLGGVQLICLGILGEYVGRIYEEVKRRPLYVVQEAVNFQQ